MLSAPGASGAPAASDPAAGRSVIDLGRLAVTCPGVRPVAGGPVAYSFRVTMTVDGADADIVRMLLPAYRDAVVVVSHGYCGFVARNARRADPEELARLILARIGAERDVPPVAVTLPDFLEKDLEAP